MVQYNSFTIDYISGIINCLDIELDNDGNAIIFPDDVSVKKLSALKEHFSSIWERANSAIDICVQKHDAKIQSGMFGLVNDFKRAMQIGFLISDRVVLIDYLYERILNRKDLAEVNIPHLCTVVTELASLLPLAQTGRVVIIPTPFQWHEESKRMMVECIKNDVEINVSIMSFINLWSITKKCNLHPYTIAESKDNYDELMSVNITSSKILTKTSLDYAYKGLLGALLTEDMLAKEGFVTIDNISLSNFQNIVQSEQKFHYEFLNRINAGGEINLNEMAIDLEKAISDEIKNIDKNKLKNFLPQGIAASSIGSYGLAYFCSASLTLNAMASILGISSTILGLLNRDNESNDPVVKVFCELRKHGF
ncbi:hypothetical protein ACKLK7_04415 [Klebsiella quasipneumoniae subsp. similipneumoniae]|uniref:Uncharacterized protein n=1 Tax=Klebsiella quasipneumoniae TaxID=1463165 RepID=A0A8G2AEH7_9ENTR|nr:hypothetical protein [Klebsiella quasipneumoniae]AZJ03076.1 hypothetical protein BME54_03860 [Klebsiella quasipneumoniae]AZJ26134.1 hypothetical protein BME36_003750 [Klebsiella quasipneumoniae subsp. similipneumoniae]ELC0920310.1 hypothetical protein [Klebsiella quasipneumoniae]MBC5046317.1 hypothetical protein [Klebsiella quasipneumoniae]MDF3329959.1 hypothetical protein [Klebsiella quasipneumoniae subsp. similipneumoniae]